MLLVSEWNFSGLEGTESTDQGSRTETWKPGFGSNSDACFRVGNSSHLKVLLREWYRRGPRGGKRDPAASRAENSCLHLLGDCQQ